MKLENILFLLFGFMLIGCEVLELPDDSGKANEQKIQVSFDFGNKSISLDDELIYYNFTEIAQFEDTYFLSSILRQDDSCITDCSNSFQLFCVLNEKNPRKVKDAFDVGEYNIGLASSNSYSYIFDHIALDSVPFKSIEWIISDVNGQLPTSQSIFDTLEMPLETAILKVSDFYGNTCQVDYELTNSNPTEHFLSVDLQYHYDSNAAILRVTHDDIGSTSLPILCVNEECNEPFSNEVQVIVGAGDSVHVTFFSVDKLSQQVVRSNFVLQPIEDGGSIHVQMDVEQEFIFLEGILDFQMVYTDEFGEVWVTEAGLGVDMFEILNVEEYLENENGNETILLELSFEASMMSTQSAEVRTIKNGRATMAFAQPK